jgi:hypothetical protein
VGLLNRERPTLSRIIQGITIANAGRRRFAARANQGLGRGVGRPLGVGTDLGVGVGRTVAVGVAVGVGVALGVGVGVGIPEGETRT